MDLDIAFKTTVLKWNTAINQNAILSYNLEPSTWQLFNLGCSDSSKKQCTNKPSNKDKGKGKTKLWGSFDGQTPPRASNLNLGMIEVTNALLAPLCSISCLHSKGHSCSCGCDCNFEHLTTWSDVVDIDNLHYWTSTTNGVMWIAPVPNHCRSSSGHTNDACNNSNNNSSNYGSNGNCSGTSSGDNGTSSTSNDNNSSTNNNSMANANGTSGSDCTTS